MRWSILSNSAYLAPAILAWGTPLSVACIALAIGSGAYHAFHDRGGRLAYWSHHADELGMYCVFSALALMAADLQSWLLILPVWGSLHLAALRYGSGQILPILASLTLGCMLSEGLYWQMGLCLAIFGASYYVRGDGNPDTLGHSAWHLGTASMIALLYVFVG